MKINRISVYRKKLRHACGACAWGRGVVPDYDSLGDPAPVYA